MNLSAFIPSARRQRALVAVALVVAAVSPAAVGSATAGAAAERSEHAVSGGVACPGLPPGLTLIGNGAHRVWSVTRTGSTFVAGIRRGHTVIRQAVRGRDGTVWVEVGAPLSSTNGRAIRRIDPDGSRRTSEVGDVNLSHVGTIGRAGRTTAATYIDLSGWRARDPFGAVYIETSSGDERKLADAGGTDHIVGSAAPASHQSRRGPFESVVAVGRFVDLDAGVSEDFAFLRMNGAAARGLHDPSEDEPFTPPSYRWPIFSPRAARMSWVEGPQWIDGYSRLVGAWTLVIADPETGRESLRVRVGGRREHLLDADYDGRYWVGTFLPPDGLSNAGDLRIRVVDTRADNPRVVGAGCTAGFLASIDRFVNAPPGF